jgi:signal transduction histidine kinase
MVRRHLPVGADASQRDEIDQLVTDTASLGEVVADLLLAAQLEHASVPATEVDLGDLAREVVASMGPYAENAGVHLEVVLSDAPEGEFVVNGAPTALRRALTALVDNAIAHSEAGGQVDLRLRSQAGSDPGAADRHGTVCLTVRDDGEGLDPAEADTLTQRFARGTSTSSGAGRRFGLGLALVDEVVRAHDGSLEIDGAPGVGSSFTLRLPRADPRAPA